MNTFYRDRKITKQGIVSHLADPRRSEIIVLDVIDSTNNYSKLLDAGLYCCGPCVEAAKAGRSVTVVAEEQTGGRGRLGRSFFSPPGCGVYMTYSFRPKFPVEDFAKITGITAVIVHRVLSRLSGKELGIKWVNDIYKGQRKITGILAEGVVEASMSSGSGDSRCSSAHGIEKIVIGIGINVFAHKLPEELTDKVGALCDSQPAGTGIGSSPSSLREMIVAEITDGLNDAFMDDHMPESFTVTSNLTEGSTISYIEWYRKYCFIIGKPVTVREFGKNPYPADVVGVTDEYGLIVRPVAPPGSTDVPLPDIVLTSGEVSIDL